MRTRRSQKTESMSLKKQNASTGWLFSRRGLFFIILILSAFWLNQIERRWGLTGITCWQVDAIEGHQTAGHIERLFKEWTNKYPRGHFLINWLFYKPIISHWEKTPVTFQDSDNRMRQTTFTPDRLKTLASISRWIVTVMYLGTVAAVFLTAWLLYGDYLSAWLAGFFLASSCLIVFYSSIGHIDLPFTFWYCWAGCFCLLTIQRGLWRYYIAAAFCAAYAVCTKEGYSLYIAGLAVVYVIYKIATEYEKEHRIKTAIASVFSLKALVAAAVFIGLFLLMSGFLGGAEEFTRRMKYMASEPMFQVPQTQYNLLKTGLLKVYLAVGWPLFLTWICGLVFLLIVNKKAFVFAAVPLFIFYGLTVTRLHFTPARYYVPACAGIALIGGHVLARLLQTKSIPWYIRGTAVFAVCVLTALYSIGLKLEMKQETRIRAEDWIRSNVSKNTLIAAGMYERYGPRLSLEGYKIIWEWHSEGVKTPKGPVQIFPEYLMVSQKWPTGSTYKDDSQYKEKLYSGRAGYTMAASFRPLYFYPSASIFSIATWPYKPGFPDEFISPDIDIFKKDTQQAPQKIVP